MGSLMNRYTYSKSFVARLGDAFVLVPDQVAENQSHFAESTVRFPARPCHANGHRRLSGRASIMVRIDADATGLGTPGIGDLVVVKAPHGG